MQSLPPKKNESGLFREVWKEYNKLREYVRSISVMPSGIRGVKVQRTSNGTLLQADAGVAAAPSSNIVRAKIQQSGADVWRATLDNGETAYVLKPWTLRKKPFHGLTKTYTDEEGVTYTAEFAYSDDALKRTVIINAGEYTETQVVIPRFLFDYDYIYISSYNPPSGELGASPEVDWLDLNIDGRSWAKSDD